MEATPLPVDKLRRVRSERLAQMCEALGMVRVEDPCPPSMPKCEIVYYHEGHRVYVFCTRREGDVVGDERHAVGVLHSI